MEMGCYAVFVRVRVDGAGQDIWSEPVARFEHERNARALEGQLQAQGHKATVQPFKIYYTDEHDKEVLLADYGQYG